MSRRTLHISSSPHLVKGLQTPDIMRHVVIALLPVVLFSIYSFGLNALLLLTTTTGVAVLTEHLLNKKTKGTTPVSDWSAVITGLLLGMTLPPNFPLWMGATGSMIAIALGKFIFGGLGYNVFNPALVGRAVLQAAFPVAITTWYPAMMSDRFNSVSNSMLTLPFMSPSYDGVSAATPLAAWKFNGIDTPVNDLALGLISGSVGETCTAAIVLGGLYMIYKGVMNWRIPVVLLSTVFLLTGGLYIMDDVLFPSPLSTMFSGGLMLGAVFMATDMVASPLTTKGVVLYSVLIGLLVVVIRIWGGMPEGVMYAILLANAASPHIDHLTQSRVYGTKRKAIL